MARTAASPSSVSFVPKLGLFDATMIVMGSMIGSGIFLAPSLMAGYLPVPQLLLLLWALGGLLTAAGAVAYGELAGMMPRAGGQYVFLREAYGPLWGFLFGWTLFFVIQTGFIAAVAIAFAKYLGVFLPVLSEQRVLARIPLGVTTVALNSAQLVGVAVIALLTAVNALGVVFGAAVQNLFTVSKILAIAALVVLAFALGDGSVGHWWASVDLGSVRPLRPDAATTGFFAAFAVAMSKALFAYDAWNSATFAAEEVRDAPRTIPRALVLGTLGVTAIYVATNLAYLYLVPVQEMAAVPDNRIGEEAARRILGQAGALFIAAAILVSTFGCDNGLILAGPRVYYAMARDGLFFRAAGRLHPRFRTPVVSLVLQGIWASVLTLSGTYNALLTYTTFASLLFGAMTVAAVFVLRRRRPEVPRPYRTPGYPVVPALYILVAAFFILYIVIGDPRSSGAGLLLVLLGLPAYAYWRRRQPAS